VLKRLVKADRLEGFLARNFPSAKRFGLEGAETLIPGLQAIVESAAAGECPYAVTLPYPNTQLPPKC
jgi:2-oxoglutarate dehydrogenase complex dehydrogenase (E1) component-like enzyme